MPDEMAANQEFFTCKVVLSYGNIKYYANVVYCYKTKGRVKLT
jgi:hypothetical protein